MAYGPPCISGTSCHINNGAAMPCRGDVRASKAKRLRAAAGAYCVVRTGAVITYSVTSRAVMSTRTGSPWRGESRW